MNHYETKRPITPLVTALRAMSLQSPMIHKLQSPQTAETLYLVSIDEDEKTNAVSLPEQKRK